MRAACTGYLLEFNRVVFKRGQLVSCKHAYVNHSLTFGQSEQFADVKFDGA